MKKVLPISGKFPQKLFAVLAIIALVAFLFSLKPVADVVKKAAEMVGIKFPPVEVFQNANANVLNLASGLILIIVGIAAVVLGVKVALIVAGASLVAYAAYRLYNTFFKGETQDIMPGSGIDRGN
jgi:hypothetical protein